MKITGKRGELRARHIISGEARMRGRGWGGSERIKRDGERMGRGGVERLFVLRYVKVDASIIHPVTLGLFFIGEGAHTREAART